VQVVAVEGDDLGTSSLVYIEDLKMNQTFELETTYLTNHSLLTFTTPDWQGANHRLFVDVSGQVSELLTFSYAAPQFAVQINTSAGVPTTGNTPFVLVGNNFGRQFITNAAGELVQIGFVTVGGVPTNCSFWNTTYIECVTPPWQVSGRCCRRVWDAAGHVLRVVCFVLRWLQGKGVDVAVVVGEQRNDRVEVRRVRWCGSLTFV
jgi:hypothetical protein